MTDIIEAVQKHDIGSPLISLFELTLDSSTLYFHPGLDENLDKLYFEDATSPYKIREYEPFPIEMTGIEYNADGATNRPTLTVANVTTIFSDLIDATNESLIGQTVTIRQTLKDNLSDETAYAINTGNGSLPIEFPKKKFIIDRIAGETALAVTFELSSPYDLQGIKVPNRQVVGKYCSWIYQGDANGVGGGCSWSKNSLVDRNKTETEILSHKAYFTVDNEPIVTTNKVSDTLAAGWSSVKGYVLYDNTNAVVADTYHEYTTDGVTTIWKAVLAQAVAGQISPRHNSKYWIRGDVCGKQLSSCKCRFQFTPWTLSTEVDTYPLTAKNSNYALPFGAFPGTKKFR
tara:strand:- start:61 stop:1095 length:1035 start_codon:yes stop_codon:yes gene_type:complete